MHEEAANGTFEFGKEKNQKEEETLKTGLVFLNLCPTATIEWILDLLKTFSWFIISGSRDYSISEYKLIK